MTVEALVAESLKGDVDAFTELVKRYQAMAYGYALATIGDVQLAEDAAQQAFLTAYRNLSALRDHSRFGGWLRAVVRFESLRILREARIHPTDSLDNGNAIDLLDQSAGPEAHAEERESIERAIAALSQLPERQRIVSILYYIYEFSQRDVAAFLDLPVSAVNNRLREARGALRKKGAFIMAGATGAVPDFSKRIGTVLHSHGMAVDAKFEGQARPGLMSTVRIGDADSAIAAFVAQYLDDDVARLIVMDAGRPGQPIVQGAGISDQSTPVSAPMSTLAVQQILAEATSDAKGDVIETGIKVIDLFAPLVAGGTVAIVGDKNAGKLVLADELLHRLGATETRMTILVFFRAPDETDAIYRLEYRTSGSLTVIGIPVSDASPSALASLLERVDTIIAMDKSLGEQGKYPAVDVLASRSQAIKDAKVVTEARTLLRQSQKDDPRAHLLRDYLTQPFFVAEPFTNRLGVRVPANVAEADLEDILHGDTEALAAIDLVMGGSLEATMSRNNTSRC